eukprot:gnl/TRDRNA2_/TRDRNA2_39628_c0_seq1.p1 gnl/TRDRNA2_/TRDRNA2_39628_c0~~gnl/TRDRNA2_/TRDRNA2_39628_c0_seq1.p1  ORF type:complete len:351 (+),score=77.01 gnl/TRDRNA2_/TRDRNA2_39628_c0_seq1:64-1116(+)
MQGVGHMDVSLEALRQTLRQQLQVAEAAIDSERTRVQMIEAEKAELDAKWQELRSEQQHLSQARANVERLREELEAEKRAMTKLGASRNDVIGLNLGGEQTVMVKRSLLLQFEGTMLAQMFSGRWEDQLDRDKDRNVFLDYSAKVAMPLIECLRLHRDMPPGQIAPQPKIRPEDRTSWDSMLDVMGLRHIFSITRFTGIKTNVNISDLFGWRLFFSKPYSHPTTMSDFMPPDAEPGAVGALLLAAREEGSDVLKVAAMGNFEVITAERDDSSTCFHNGVHWYCKQKASVGFAPNKDVGLNFADSSNLGCKLRLSWHLQHELGGWRAGDACELSNSPQWEKLIFWSSMRLD